MEKRKDNKGRILRTGESQRADGQYMYRYTDISGKRRTIYSWRLTETDKIPGGKNSKKSLRELEKMAQKKVSENQIENSETINSLFEKFIFNRTDLKISTKSNYRNLYDNHIRDEIGMLPITKLKYTDVYSLYLRLHDKGLSVRTIQILNGILWQIGYDAEKDRLITYNPVEGAMKKILKTVKEEHPKKHALTVEQQLGFINYIYGSPTYYKYGPLFTVMLGTGMRIGEVLGLTWDDVDFDANTISVNHTIRYIPDSEGKFKHQILTPKTIAGIRTIPMFDTVKTALLEMQERRIRTNKIDGYDDFIFVNSNRNPYTGFNIYNLIQDIVVDYNVSHKDKIPKISPHTFRHTFCTRLCEVETDIKFIQEVMGHKRITTTMDVYNEIQDSTRDRKLGDLEGKMVIR